MDELDPITHTEYSGKVGFEKKIRQTHWGMPDVKIISNLDTGYVWVKDGVGKWRRVKKHAAQEG